MGIAVRQINIKLGVMGLGYISTISDDYSATRDLFYYKARRFKAKITISGVGAAPQSGRTRRFLAHDVGRFSTETGLK